MGDVGPVALEEVAEVLSERLRFLRREPPAQRWGRVFVGSIEEARGREFGVVFLPGLAEGLFPQRMLEDPLLLDELREAVSEHLPLRRGTRTRRADALAPRRRSGARPADRFLSAHGSGRSASARAELLRAGIAARGGRFASGAEGVRGSRTRSRARPAELARSEGGRRRDRRRGVRPGYDRRCARGPARCITWWRPIRTWRAPCADAGPAGSGTWRPADGLVTDDSAALEALREQRLGARAWSPSALEHFAVCPYKFALHGIYRLKPRDESEQLQQMDPRTRGALFHEIQFELFQDLQRCGIASRQR